MKSIQIIYGSGGGNTELVCKELQDLLSAQFEVTLTPAMYATSEQLKSANLTILASPTYGHGLLENYMARYISKQQNVELTGQAFAIVGLGDDKYDSDYFIESAKILEEFCKERGGIEKLEALKIWKTPLTQLKEIKDWSKKLIKSLK